MKYTVPCRWPEKSQKGYQSHHPPKRLSTRRIQQVGHPTRDQKSDYKMHIEKVATEEHDLSRVGVAMTIQDDQYQ
jgi:hypothetical protein